MITASMIALSLLQSAIPAASVTARADLSSMLWELFGPAEPVLAQRSAAAAPIKIPLRQSFFWTDEMGCIRPNSWDEFCRHYPVHAASSDVLLAVATSAPAFRFGDPLPLPSMIREYGLFLCGSRSWCLGFRYSGFSFGYSAYTDLQGYFVQQAERAEILSSIGLRTGLELEARGLIGGGSKGSGQAGGGSQGSAQAGSGSRGSGYAGGGSSGSGPAGGGYSGSASSAGSAGHGGGAGYGGGGRGSSGGGKPGAELP